MKPTGIHIVLYNLHSLLMEQKVESKLAREFRTKLINIKFTVLSVVFCVRIFSFKMKFHDGRNGHFMMVRDTSFKHICFHETKLEIYQ